MNLRNGLLVERELKAARHLVVTTGIFVPAIKRISVLSATA